MHAKQTQLVPWRILFCLPVLALMLSETGVFAAEKEEAVKKSTGSYLSGERKINVTRFEPGRRGAYPAILLLHGADGPDTNEATYNALAERLAGRNYVVFVVRYFDRFADRPKELAFFQANVKEHFKAKENTGPDHKRLKGIFDECLATVADGVQYARSQPGVDEKRLGMVGFSLGAFLALSAATREELKINAVIDLFGGLPEEMHQQAKALPPVLILHGDKDQTVPVDAAQTLQKVLKDNHSVYDMKVYEGVGHLFYDNKGGLCWTAAFDAEKRATAFLQKHLQRHDAESTASR